MNECEPTIKPLSLRERDEYLMIVKGEFYTDLHKKYSLESLRHEIIIGFSGF